MRRVVMTKGGHRKENFTATMTFRHGRGGGEQDHGSWVWWRCQAAWCTMVMRAHWCKGGVVSHPRCQSRPVGGGAFSHPGRAIAMDWLNAMAREDSPNGPSQRARLGSRIKCKPGPRCANAGPRGGWCHTTELEICSLERMPHEIIPYLRVFS